MKNQVDLLKEMVGEHPDASPKKMPTTKIEAFLKQFPWVRDYIKDPIVQVYVTRAEPDLIGNRLSHMTRYRYAWDGKEAYHQYEKVFLLDENFELVTSKRREFYEDRKYHFLGFGFGPTVQREKATHFDGTTTCSVRSALEKLGEESCRVRIFLSYFYYTQAVIVYKLPKGENLKDWAKRQIDAERGYFERDFNEI